MKTITTAEELEAVHAREDAIIRGSGTYRDGMSTFTSCYAVPVPDDITGSDERYWAVIVHGTSWLDSLVKESDIRLPATLIHPRRYGDEELGAVAAAIETRRQLNPHADSIALARAALKTLEEDQS